MIEIRTVSSPKDLDAFIALPNRIQKSDLAYIAPLAMERREALSPKHNPFFRHSDVRFLTAWRDGRMVGRISAQVDRRVQGTGHFGLLSAENDPAIFTALFRAAEDWLRAMGRTHVLGPFDLSINEEIGTLVDGFDTPPMLLMPHNPRWQPSRIEEQGYAKAKDVYAYLFNAPTDTPAWAERLVGRQARRGVVLRQLEWKRYDEELAAIVSIFNDAWSENWNFLPLDNLDLEALAKSLKPLIRSELVQIVEVDGKAAGFGVCLPNLNEAIRDLDGSLLPLGWAKLLWRLKVTGTKTSRVPLMGVRKRYARTPLGGVLPLMIMNALGRESVKLGMDRIEMSWVLEDNRAMRHLCETMAGPPYKSYRVYEKSL
ncbi:dATP pyrophosphohydrolase [Aureimonas psammosilenae]|uniref:dATP pyrophosphohydrolase n=1 Tax=Aureimonas psammosilenae TaxID=2495496 RepID=UPI001F32A4D2|nr:dATP pyrophosphohydrolase [Aureimonas psammosilenae]